MLALANYIRAHPFSTDSILSVTLAPLFSVSLRDLPTPLFPALLAALLLAAEAAAALALGLKVMAWFFPGTTSRSDRILFAILAGMGVISLVQLGAGFVGFFNAGLFGLIFAASLLSFKESFSEIRGLFKESHPGRLPAWAVLGLGAVVLTQVGSLVSGYTPPHISDEQTYHLATAKWYLQLGKIAFWPSNVYFFYPQMDTMLYAPFLSAGLLYGIKWLHWAAGILAGWGLWLILGNVPRSIRIGAMLFYFTIPAVWIVAGRAFNDLLILAYAAGALLAALRAKELPGRRGFFYALLAGACVGFAASNKYNGLLLGILLMPFLNFRRLAAAGVAAGVVFSPWLVKNWIWLENPLFPYFWRILGGLGWDENLAWRYKKKLLQADITFARKLLEVPALPWTLPIKNLGSGTHSNTGPLIAIGIPLLFLRTGTLGLTGLAALVGFFLPTVFGSIGTRYLIPAIPLMLLLGTGVLASFSSLLRRRALLASGFVFLLFYQACEIYTTAWKDYDDPIRLAFGREKLPKYLDRMLYPHLYYPYSYSLMLDAVQNRTPRDAGILFLGAYGGSFYIPRRTIFAPMLGRPLPLIISRDSFQLPEMRKKFKQLKITHVLANRRHPDIFFDYWKVWDWTSVQALAKWRDFWDSYAVLEWKFSDHFTLHSLSATPVDQPHQTTPGYEEETLKLIRTIMGKKDYDYAAAILNPVTKLFPENPETWLRAAQYFVATGKIYEAESCCKEAGRIRPDSDEYRQCRAMLLTQQGKLEEAVRLLEKVTERKALDPQAWADLYVLYSALGRTDKAAVAKTQYQLVREFRPYR